MTLPDGVRLLVGAYTASSGGDSTGIALVERSADGVLAASTVAVVDDPSFLAVDGDRVYVVAETTEGGVHAFRRSGDSSSFALEHRWAAPSGGDAPCHVRVDPAGVVAVANYTSGTVTVLALDGDQSNAPASSTVALPAVVGPVADRQEGPHAHQSIADPAAGTVLVADLGGDAIHEFRVAMRDGGPALEPLAVHQLAPGVGPRHMAWLGEDLLVTGELDGRVHRLRRTAAPGTGTGTGAPTAPGGFAVVGSAATAPDPRPDDVTVTGSTGESYLSHIDVDDAGRIYVAVRGRDTIAVLVVDAATDTLTLVDEVPCGGVWPRHFALVSGAIVVANQLSGELTVLPLDPTTGVPGSVTERIAVGTPTCVVAID